MDEQMDLFSFIDNPYETYRDKLTREGFTNAYDRMPDHDCEVLVVDHNENRFKTRAYKNKFGYMVFDSTKGRGYDICWWKEIGPIRSCGDCKYFRTYVDAYTCEPLGTICVDDSPLSRPANAEDPACKRWAKKEDK